MKKLFFLLISIIIVSCSNDDSQPVNPNDGVTIEFESRSCNGGCYVNYNVTNNSDYIKDIKIKFTFNQFDDTNQADVIYEDVTLFENEGGIVQINVDDDTEVISYEIDNVILSPLN